MFRKWLFIALGAIGVLLLILLFNLMSQSAPMEAPKGSSNWDTYITLLTNVPHIFLEITLEVVTGLFLYPLGKFLWQRAIRKHDEEFHPGDHPHHD